MENVPGLVLQRSKPCLSAGSLPRSCSIWAEWLQLLPALLAPCSCCRSCEQRMAPSASEAPYSTRGVSCSRFPPSCLPTDLATGQQGPGQCPRLWAGG